MRNEHFIPALIFYLVCLVFFGVKFLGGLVVSLSLVWLLLLGLSTEYPVVVSLILAGGFFVALLAAINWVVEWDTERRKPPPRS